ncbi:hypothetical protein SAMN04488697_105250 [Pseudomonas sp. 43mfcvi1.1]|nr:hypothetical protein ATJ40_105250 [Pseudomonas sp. 43mfcvi1.1]SSB96602.1 hypothetical protein SAMN04488697_105250 [Pseudomonas sp. 43mfcvi1.1]
MTKEEFAGFNAGDKVEIRLDPNSRATQWVYFHEIFAERLEYHDLNYREYSVELSALTSPTDS